MRSSDDPKLRNASTGLLHQLGLINIHDERPEQQSVPPLSPTKEHPNQQSVPPPSTFDEPREQQFKPPPPPPPPPSSSPPPPQPGLIEIHNEPQKQQLVPPPPSSLLPTSSEQQQREPLPSYETPAPGGFNVMISYNWDHQEKAKIIRDSLKMHGWYPWMDDSQMGK